MAHVAPERNQKIKPGDKPEYDKDQKEAEDNREGVSIIRIRLKRFKGENINIYRADNKKRIYDILKILLTKNRGRRADPKKEDK